MNKILLTAIIGFTFISFQLSAQETFKSTEGDTTYLMQKYFMCFLSRGNSEKFDSTQLVDIQLRHLNYLNNLAKNGKISIAGPFADDGDVRGIVIYNVATLNEAVELQNEDPAVKSGILKSEIRPWWSAKGSALK